MSSIFTYAWTDALDKASLAVSGDFFASGLMDNLRDPFLEAR